MSTTSPAPTQIQDEDEPASSAPGELPPGQHEKRVSDWSPAAAFLRLMLGVALEGGDQLIARLRQWELATRPAPTDTERTATVPELQRLTTLGMVLEAQARVGDLIESLWHATDDMADRMSRSANFALERWPFQLLRPRLVRLRHDFEEAIDEWAALGRREEEQARLMARQAAASVMDEVVEYLARNPEVRQLIEQQSASLAGTAVDGVRERTATADRVVEHLVHNLLRRHGDAPITLPPNGKTNGTSTSQSPQ